MATLADLNRLKDKVEAAKTEQAKASGAVESLLARLQTDHGCSNLEDAEAKLQKIVRQTNEAKAAYDAAFDKFVEENNV